MIRAAQQGSLEAFTALYWRYLQPVYRRVTCRIPTADVEDVTQEVFVEVIRSLAGYRGEATFATWLRALTDHCIARYYRRRQRTPAGVAADDAGLEAGMPDTVIPGPANHTPLDDRLILREALNRLPEHYREVILLRFAEGLRFDEIARLRGQSLEATKSLFRRAMAALREQVRE